MRITVHSPWLPGYIDVAQTVLVTLTMAGLFLDRSRMPKNHQTFSLNTPTDFKVSIMRITFTNKKTYFLENNKGLS